MPALSAIQDNLVFNYSELESSVNVSGMGNITNRGQVDGVFNYSELESSVNGLFLMLVSRKILPWVFNYSELESSVNCHWRNCWFGWFGFGFQLFRTRKLGEQNHG